MVIAVLTEFTNTATAATFLPLVGAMAIGLGVDQMLRCRWRWPRRRRSDARRDPSERHRLRLRLRVDGQHGARGIWLNIIALVVVGRRDDPDRRVFGIVY